MGDSSSFTSLFALVDSHLSKTNLLESTSSDNGFANSFPMTIPNGAQKGLSDTRLPSPGRRLPIPRLSLSESPITSVLSLQISNMLKAKELKRQQELEKKKLEEEMRELKLDDCVIDLMKAVRTPSMPMPEREVEVLSTSSSFESLFFDNTDFLFGSISETDTKVRSKPSLPCKTDLTSILHQKIKRGRCSSFGKVLISRLRPKAPIYLRDQIKSDIVRFNFDTKSPCDLIKEKLKKPAVYTTSNFVLDFINAN